MKINDIQEKVTTSNVHKSYMWNEQQLCAIVDLTWRQPLSTVPKFDDLKSVEPSITKASLKFDRKPFFFFLFFVRRLQYLKAMTSILLNKTMHLDAQWLAGNEVHDASLAINPLNSTQSLEKAISTESSLNLERSLYDSSTSNQQSLKNRIRNW